jgi:hypothetical protein
MVISDQPLAIPERQTSERAWLIVQSGSSGHHIDRQIGFEQSPFRSAISSISHQIVQPGSVITSGYQRSLGSHQLRAGILAPFSLSSSGSFEIVTKKRIPREG